ncbi:MAG: pyridoxamine 5'-phosphate oxidase family protein [Bacilli bacterium]|nr:pyridoxamine 5'-phosphate oxidase family protein [Bacilli bacterium]
MDLYNKSLSVLKELFARDYQFSLATSKNDVPSIRVVDAYYEDESFWIVTYGDSKKVSEITGNPNVALCHNLFSFKGKAYNVGHPLEKENLAIREKLIKVFEKWYFHHNNESNNKTCYIRIGLTSGFFYKDGIGYKVDFINKSVETFPFESEVVIIE